MHIFKSSESGPYCSLDVYTNYYIDYSKYCNIFICVYGDKKLR